MRRRVISLSVAAGLLCAAGASAAASLPVPVPVTVPSTPAAAPFLSGNVKHVGTVPLDGAGVSMEVRTVGKQVRAFVSGAGGLSIYDATDPKAPTLLGHLPIYNWENEDVQVTKDGKTAFLTEFTAGAYLHAVDVSDPTLPRITDSILGDGPHTVVCADDPCTYLYGSDGRTYDVKDRANISILPAAQGWATLVKATGSIHNLHRDEAGVWISDTTPLVMFEQTNGNPLTLKRLGEGGTNNAEYQHNNIRVDADDYKARPVKVENGKKVPLEPDNKKLKPGELLLGNGETNFTGQCEAGTNGAFSTWSLANYESGQKFTQLDILEPLSGDYTNGDPALNGLGCSGHWFTEKDSADGKDVLVAGAWYEHGTRFLKVDKSTGKIRQVGFFQPVRGAASEAFWMPGSNVVWTVDYHSSIDILEFDEKAAEPSTEQIDQSWLIKAGVVDPFAEAVRDLCKAGADLAVSEDLPGHVAQHHATGEVAAATGLTTFAELAALRR